MIGCISLVLLCPVAGAQEEKKKEKKPIAVVNEVRVGFRSNRLEDAQNRHKVGLWAPVYVIISAGEEGLPTKSQKPCSLLIETVDSEDVGTIYTLEPVVVEPNSTQTIVAYVKPGNIMADVKATLRVDGRSFTAQSSGNALNLNKHIYLSLGARLPDMEKALAIFKARANVVERDFQDMVNRFAAFEAEYSRLPDLWFGYQGVDLMILNTTNRKFLDALATDKESTRLKALAQWVRRGGRLVIPVSWPTQDVLAALLHNPQAWQPPVAVVPPANPGDVKQNAAQRLEELLRWGKVDQPFPVGEEGVLLAALQPPGMRPTNWEVHARADDGRPLITRQPYGLGSITFLAFELDQGPFSRWAGAGQFLTTMIDRLAPQPLKHFDKQGRHLDGIDFHEPDAFDLATELHNRLEDFDVQVVPFGWVALFIILYILVVGPLDYVILRFVFKRLEWTWFTFPAVVVAVSVAAYYTAYALKGNDLKINKVDVVDMDLRTHVDGEERPVRAYAYGQSFFTLMSPRIDNYTVGVEPNPVFWGGQAAKPKSADVVSWFGRPGRKEAFGMGQSRTQSFFRKPYKYAEDAVGLIDVPIPVWTTKSFTASWEAALEQIPLEADLTYLAGARKAADPDLLVSGSLQSNLPMDLEDVWLIYGDNFYFLEGGLPGIKAGTKVFVQLGRKQTAQAYKDWLIVYRKEGERTRGGKAIQDPTNIMKTMLIHETKDVGGNIPNHSNRALDLSWRMREPPPGNDGIVREAILVARAPFQFGRPEEVMADSATPVPTRLWLHDLPEGDKKWPVFQGRIAQDTYIRILLPVRPAK